MSRGSKPSENGYPSPMTSHAPHTEPGGSGDNKQDDVESDPAKGADDRSDWSDEGGATPSGPAGDSDSA